MAWRDLYHKVGVDGCSRSTVVAGCQGSCNGVLELLIVEAGYYGLDKFCESPVFQRVLRPRPNLFLASANKRDLDIPGLRSRMDSWAIVDTAELISTARATLRSGLILWKVSGEFGGEGASRVFRRTIRPSLSSSRHCVIKIACP